MKKKTDRKPESRQLSDVLGFASHTLRPSPIEGEIISMAAEIGALLNRHDTALQRLQQAKETVERNGQELLGRIAQLVYHVGQTLAKNEPEFIRAGMNRPLRQLQILKDLLKDLLDQQGISWRDPTGEAYEGPLVEMVDVDGWRHASEYPGEIVIDTREPIVFCNGQLVAPGAVVIGAPGDSPEFESIE